MPLCLVQSINIVRIVRVQEVQVSPQPCSIFSTRSLSTLLH